MAKERWAMQQCYEQCAPYVFTIIKNYIYNETDQQDVMQETFAQVFYSIQNYDSNKGKFKSWISQIAINQAINFLRKNKKLSFLVPLNEEALDIKEEITKIERLDKIQLNQCIEIMPIGYRTVFLLNLVEGYTHDEIAQILKITAQTSRSQLSRAIKWLRKHIQQHQKTLTYG